MDRMVIAFRVDGSKKIGTGHYMRCLVIAKSLRDRGLECIFVSKNHEDLLGNIITNEGFKLITLETDKTLTDEYTYQNWAAGGSFLDGKKCGNLSAEIWFIDHYGLDKEWTKGLKTKNKNARIIVLDDLQNRELAGDILIDPNIRTKKQEEKWKNLK